MSYKTELSGTPKPKKHNRRKISFYKGQWILANHDHTIFKSKKFGYKGAARDNLLALKRHLEELTYTEIDLAFRETKPEAKPEALT